MLRLRGVNHIAIICSDYQASLGFYCSVLGCRIISEEYRAERRSMMTKLSLGGEYLIELFTFPDSPDRPSYPEACGLRHLAFTVENLAQTVQELERMGVPHEPVRTAPNGEQCCFIHDPDGLPIELVSSQPPSSTIGPFYA
ncbi:MAG: VOC family protein [Bacteroidaceae bacterium]|nr:VOC family protein [Bacteroidaceae bacterium]MBQ6085260.1 VOC family protein [Bacteroidaceae bacterium]